MWRSSDRSGRNRHRAGIGNEIATSITSGVELSSGHSHSRTNGRRIRRLAGLRRVSSRHLRQLEEDENGERSPGSKDSSRSDSWEFFEARPIGDVQERRHRVHYGSKWKQRYFTKIGDDCFVFPAQWDVFGRPYYVKASTDWWTVSDGLSFGEVQHCK